MGAKNGNARPVMGRKLCMSKHHQGPRWVPILNFAVEARLKGGAPLYWTSWCYACARMERRAVRGDSGRRYYEKPRLTSTEKSRKRYARILADPELHESYKEMWRFQKERKRREKGIQPRTIGPASKKYGLNRHRSGSISKVLDAGPLLEVFDELEKRRKAAQYGAAFGEMDTATLHDILGETLTRSLRRARQTGRITEVVASDILDLLPTNNSIHTLWPDT